MWGSQARYLPIVPCFRQGEEKFCPQPRPDLAKQYIYLLPPLAQLYVSAGPVWMSSRRARSG